MKNFLKFLTILKVAQVILVILDPLISRDTKEDSQTEKEVFVLPLGKTTTLSHEESENLSR